MKADEVRQLREAWKARGSPPCEHAIVDREYDLGADTGRKVCMACGASVPDSESRRSGGHGDTPGPNVPRGYRRHKGAETWHFCTNCSHWPLHDYSFSPTRPSSGSFCNECISKVASGR